MMQHLASNNVFIILLALIALMLIVLSVAVFGFIIPIENHSQHRATVLCRSIEQFGDDRAASLKEQRRAIEARRNPMTGKLQPGDEILLANNERASDDISSINFLLDQECP